MPPKPAMAPAKASSSGTKPILIGIIGLVLGFIGGYGLGRVSTGTPINPVAAPQGGSTAASDDPATRLRDAGLLPPVPTETSALSGTVVAVSPSSLAFDADMSPFGMTGTSRRTATLTADTAFIRLVEKSPQEVAADRQAFTAASSDPDREGPPPSFPSPFKEVRISASDLTVGEAVTVEADSDILKADTFTATRVVVAMPIENGAPAPAPAPAPEPAPQP